MHYERHDIDFHRGSFRVRGDRVEIFPAYEESQALRIDFFGEMVERVALIDPLKGTVQNVLKQVTLFPASHYVTSKGTLQRAIQAIQHELKGRMDDLRAGNKLIEAQRIEERTNFDLEMMLELGYCNGIENYSRHLTGRNAGQPPPTLLDYFPSDFLLFIDESHIGLPQLRAMYRGDRSRKETLVNYGFRLPSALDNRPLRFSEFEARVSQVVYVSATPGEFEIERGKATLVEQIVRPTGLLDPQILVRPAANQVDDLLAEIRIRQERRERVLITTLTKRLAEDLTEYYADLDVKVRYLHSDISTLERMDIIRDLRLGHFDVLVGINLLREGLDLPEVSLIAILDADKEGFLRSARSLIQTCGRAARHVNGTVIMYADGVTGAMQQAIDETVRRRTIQKAYNRRNNITPVSIAKEIKTIFESVYEADYVELPGVSEPNRPFRSAEDLDQTIKQMEQEMYAAAKELAFEKAAELRDKITDLKKMVLFEIG
jgi:excinuclease ABC subunit B